MHLTSWEWQVQTLESTLLARGWFRYGGQQSGHPDKAGTDQQACMVGAQGIQGGQ